MARPVSISVKQISTAAKGSVTKALEQHKASFPANPDYRIGFIPPHCWLGFVVYNPLDKLSIGDAQKLATDVHGSIAGSVSAVKGGIPGVIAGGGHIICGFLPPPDVNVFEE